jgi:hypothetical protein
MTVMDEIRLSTGQPAQLRDGIEPSAEAMDMARVWMQSSGRGEPYERRLASMFDHFAAEATAAERERIARRVSEHQILRFQVGRDPLVEVNEVIQDLAYDIATNWEDYE